MQMVMPARSQKEESEAEKQKRLKSASVRAFERTNRGREEHINHNKQ